MDFVLQVVVWVHVAAGFIGLAAFWVPIFARKGGANHKLYGKVFKVCAYFVLGAAIFSVSYHLLEAAFTGVGPSNNPDNYAFVVFLGYLAVVTLIGLRHGLEVLNYKKNMPGYNRPLNVGLGWLAISASLWIIGYALYYQPGNAILLYALSPIGISTGYDVLRVAKGLKLEAKTWFYEHMGGLIGAGIAFHTAFAVFGSLQIFDLGLQGPIAVIPWVTPAIIGIPGVIIWTRYYRQKFGDLPV